jgi:hypothetical protein
MGNIGMNHHRRLHVRQNEAAAANNNGDEDAPAENNGNEGNNNNGNEENNEGAGNNVGPNGGLLGDILRQAGLGDNGEILEIDYGYLLSQTRKGLYTIHHSWIPFMVSITIALINMGCEENETRQLEGIAALELFPGVLTRTKEDTYVNATESYKWWCQQQSEIHHRTSYLPK